MRYRRLGGGGHVPLDLLLQAMTVLQRTSLVDCVNNEDSLNLTGADEFYDEKDAYICMYIYIY